MQLRISIYSPRPRKVIFVKGAESLTYGQIVHAIDATKAAGITIVGLVPRATAQGLTTAPPPPT